jgi:hypothetical protein
MACQINKDAYALAERLNDALADREYPLTTVFMCAVILAKELGRDDGFCKDMLNCALDVWNRNESRTFIMPDLS